MRILYKVDEELYTSRELIRKYHPDGEMAVYKADHWQELGYNQAPGFAKELREAAHMAKAVRMEEITLNGRGRTKLRVAEDQLT